MKTHQLRLSIILSLSLLVFVSCSVSKRHYLKGYHIEWLSAGVPKTHQPNSHYSFDKIESQEAAINALSIKAKGVGANRVRPETIAFQQNIKEKAALTYTNGCDIMIFRAGEELEVKVLEVLPNSVKYKYCDKLEGPTYETQKKDIFMVKYASGSREVFEVPQNSPSINNSNSGPTNGPIINSQPSGGNSYVKSGTTGDRSFYITLVLLLLVGWLGVHRFYLGHYGIGILYLLTFGLCGIGVLVDLVLLLVGELEPEDGDFTDY